MSTSADPSAIEALFRPRRVAVVGASDRVGSPGEVLWRNLAGFPGEVVPVTRTAEQVGGVPAYPRLTDVPGEVDLAVVAVPAAAAVEVVRDGAAAGVRAMVVVSAGFAESGPDGAALQREMVALCRDAGIALVGPNCLGVQNLVTGLNASLAAGPGRGGGGISLITQSGSYAMAVAAVSSDEGARFALVASTGNRAVLADHQLLDVVAADPATRVVCLFVESVDDGPALLAGIRRVAGRIPVVVAAVGASPDGARAAASHTAALASDRRVWRDVLTAAGAVVAEHGQEMLDTARGFAAQPFPAGGRVALVTNSGGLGTELADLLAAEGLSVPELSGALQERLAALLPAYASARNPVDVTPAWSRFASMYSGAVDLIARSGEVDIVVPVLVHRAADASVTGALAETVRVLRADGVDVPVHVCWVAPRATTPARGPLDEADVPVYEWPARTARVLGHATRYGRQRAADRDRRPWAAAATAPVAPPRGIDTDPNALRERLTAAGIPVIETRVCADVRDAVAAAGELGFPLVAKVLHPAISHKTDVGGVVVGIRDPEEATRAATRLLSLREGARVQLQPQVRGVELLVSARRDPTFGPVVAAGPGGVLVELLDDLRFAPAPLTVDDAHRLLLSSRASRLLAGVRGSAPVDALPVAEMVARLGDLLVAEPALREVELNPVVLTSHGPVAVDVRVTVSSAEVAR